MAFRDLREWIKKLEEIGEAKHIKAEVNWEEEIGAITKRNIDLDGPALLFENIKGYKESPCRRLLTCSVASYKRVALMLGLEEKASPKEMVLHYRDKIRERIKPVVVNHGAVKDNIVKGEGIDIGIFPAPKYNPFDGGRYFITTGGIATKDPETGWINVGLYRGMMIDGRSMTIQATIHQHFHQHLNKYRKIGKKMPAAYFIGGDPLYAFCAGSFYPEGVNEYEVMGALRGEGVELIRCETSDLAVPADAEIVLEGTVDPEFSSYKEEGPFGEFTGYYAGHKSLQPVFAVEAISYRNDPIFQGSPRSRPPDEAGYLSSLARSANGWSILERAGVPGITDVYCTPVTGGSLAIVQINKRYQGHSKQVASALWGASPTTFKNVMVVEEDVDIYNYRDLEWAFTWRVDAKEDGIVIFPGMPGLRYDPSAYPEWKDPNVHGLARWNRVLIDATRDWRMEPNPDWGGERYPQVVDPRPEMKKIVENRWKEYGF